MRYIKENMEFTESLRRYPFIRQFMGNYNISSEKVNRYMGYRHINYNDILTSMSMNSVMNEAFERGDINSQGKLSR